MPKSHYEQFTETTYSGKKLLESHSLSETGTWRILGEDPNCDFGGPHHSPFLGTVEGKLEDVIRYAVELPGFWQWGFGGSIEKVEVKKIDSKISRRTAELELKKAELERQLAEINRQLK